MEAGVEGGAEAGEGDVVGTEAETGAESPCPVGGGGDDGARGYSDTHRSEERRVSE